MKADQQTIIPKLFLFSLCFLLLLTLGVWQLNKDYYTKAKRIEFSNILAQNPKNIKTFNKLVNTPAYISITGVFMENSSIYIEPRTNNGKVGYHKITPLKTINKIYLINRGFTESKIKEKVNNKTISMSGIIIEIPNKNFFSLENDLNNNKWYILDTKDIKTYFSIEVEPYIIYEKNESESKNGIYLQVMPKIVSQVNHLHYAITWFLVALSICIMFLINLRGENEQ